MPGVYHAATYVSRAPYLPDKSYGMATPATPAPPVRYTPDYACAPSQARYAPHYAPPPNHGRCGANYAPAARAAGYGPSHAPPQNQAAYPLFFPPQQTQTCPITQSYRIQSSATPGIRFQVRRLPTVPPPTNTPPIKPSHRQCPYRECSAIFVTSRLQATIMAELIHAIHHLGIRMRAGTGRPGTFVKRGTSRKGLQTLGLLEVNCCRLCTDGKQISR
jgi:hypothetical protein